MNFLFKLTFIMGDRPKFISMSIIDQSASPREMQKLKERNWGAYNTLVMRGRGATQTGKFRTVYRMLKTPGVIPPIDLIEKIIKVEMLYREPGSVDYYETYSATRHPDYS